MKKDEKSTTGQQPAAGRKAVVRKYSALDAKPEPSGLDRALWPERYRRR